MCVRSIFAQFARYCLGKCSHISCSSLFRTQHSIWYRLSLPVPFSIRNIELSIYLFLPEKFTNLRLWERMLISIFFLGYKNENSNKMYTVQCQWPIKLTQLFNRHHYQRHHQQHQQQQQHFPNNRTIAWTCISLDFAFCCATYLHFVQILCNDFQIIHRLLFANGFFFSLVRSGLGCIFTLWNSRAFYVSFAISLEQRHSVPDISCRLFGISVSNITKGKYCSHCLLATRGKALNYSCYDHWNVLDIWIVYVLRSNNSCFFVNRSIIFSFIPFFCALFTFTENKRWILTFFHFAYFHSRRFPEFFVPSASDICDRCSACVYLI